MCYCPLLIVNTKNDFKICFAQFWIPLVCIHIRKILTIFRVMKAPWIWYGLTNNQWKLDSFFITSIINWLLGMMDFVSQMPMAELIFCFCTDSEVNVCHCHVTLFIASLLETIGFYLSFLLFVNEQCRHDGPAAFTAQKLSGFCLPVWPVCTYVNELWHNSHPLWEGRNFNWNFWAQLQVCLNNIEIKLVDSSGKRSAKHAKFIMTTEWNPWICYISISW